MTRRREALVDVASDPEQVRDAKRLFKQRKGREQTDMAAVLATPEGRRCFWGLLEHCAAFRSVMAATDSLTNYNAGRQDVGHYLLERMEMARPGSYTEMMIAVRDERLERAARPKKPKKGTDHA